MFNERSTASGSTQCSFKEAGCEWVGELGEIPDHLNDDTKSDSYKSSDCPFLQLNCKYCKEKFQRQDVFRHELNECLKPPYKCDICIEFESTFEEVTTKHVNVCPCGLVLCPNNCGISLQRKNIKDHQTTNCPLEVVTCSFSYAGCEEKLPRKNMPSHISDSLAIHMSLQAVSYQKEIEKLRAEITELGTHLRIMPITILLDGFASKKAAGDCWSSHPFYTHLQGYKLRLSVSCNGNSEGEGTHISVYACVMNGDHDDEIEWPFQRSVTIQLLDQKDGKHHHEYVLTFDDAPSDCTERAKFPRRLRGREHLWHTHNYPHIISLMILSPSGSHKR